jgi:exopolysaccharide biosynthesis polyprenyl glycosylphosphotransferase
VVKLVRCCYVVARGVWKVNALDESVGLACRGCGGAGKEVRSASLRLASALMWQYRSHLLVVMDVFLIAFACWLGHVVRFDVASLALLVPIVPVADPNDVVYLLASVMLIITWILLIWREGGYRAHLYSMIPLSDQLTTLLKSALLAGGVTMVMLFLVRPILVSRVFLFLTMVFGVALTMMSRAVLVVFDQWLGSRGAILNRLVIVGTRESLPPLVERLHNTNTSLGFVGIVHLGREDDNNTDPVTGLPLLGAVEDIGRICNEHSFDGILFVANGYDFGCNPEIKEAIIGAVNFCEGRKIPFYLVPHSLDVAVVRKEMGSLYGCPIIQIRDASQHALYRWIKRFLDVTVSTLVLVLGLPLWLSIMAMIKLTSKGPVIYTQERVGLNGRLFRMYKFRTMVCDAEQRLCEIVDFDSLNDPVFKIENDPRVTRTGGFLRRTGLDEIPQLVNVLRGEMSIVGPRPEQVELVERYNVWQRRRLKGVPGITGYQQVMCRGVPCLNQRIEYDLHYLKHQSFSLDLLILLRTLMVIIRGVGIH